jgi:hypothetical protein
VLARRRVGVVVGELVVEDRVGDDVPRDLPEQRAAPDLAEGSLVDDPVHCLAHVDVVERRLRQVHRQVVDEVARVEVEVLLLRRIGGVPLERLRRQAGRVLVLELARADLVGALEHVRAGRDDVSPVLAGLSLEALRDLDRDRPGRGHCEPVQEVAGGLREVEHDRAGVRGRDPRDRLRLTGL